MMISNPFVVLVVEDDSLFLFVGCFSFDLLIEFVEEEMSFVVLSAGTTTTKEDVRGIGWLYFDVGECAPKSKYGRNPSSSLRHHCFFLKRGRMGSPDTLAYKKRGWNEINVGVRI